MSMPQDPSSLPPLAQIALGGVLGGAHWWVPALSELNLVLGSVASICGATVGLISVWKIVRGSREP